MNVDQLLPGCKVLDCADSGLQVAWNAIHGGIRQRQMDGRWMVAVRDAQNIEWEVAESVSTIVDTHELAIQKLVEICLKLNASRLERK